MKEIIGDFTYNGKNKESTAKKVIINILHNKLPDYPVIPEYQNPELMDEWVNGC